MVTSYTNSIADALPLSSAVIQTPGMNDIRFDEVRCRGDETSLIQCQRERTGCLSSFAAGVICTGNSFMHKDYICHYC